MVSKEFDHISQDYLNQLYQQLESDYPDIDIEINHDKIMVTIFATKVFLISIHNAMHQIWLASPVSGAHHFFYKDKGSCWISTRDHSTELKYILKQEIDDILT